MIPALHQATTDPRLTDQDVRVLTYLAAHLDYREFTPIKEVVVRRALQCGRSTLYDSLKRLTRHGYLERTAHIPGDRRSYRIVRSVQEPERTSVVQP